MAEQVVPAIVQEWTLRTEQAQANARALGAQVDASAKQGTAAAAQLDGAMNRTAISTEKAAGAGLSLRKQMRLVTISVAAFSAVEQVASSSSQDLAKNIGAATKNVGLLIALTGNPLIGLPLFGIGLAIEKISAITERGRARAQEYFKTISAGYKQNLLLDRELTLLMRAPAAYDDVLDAEKELLRLLDKRLALRSLTQTPDVETDLDRADEEARILGIAVARERTKQALMESNEVAKVTRELGKSEAVLLAERIRLLNDEADALETTNALAGDDAAITQTQATEYRNLADALREYRDTAAAAFDAQFELSQAQAEAAFKIGTSPVIDPLTNQMDEAKTRAKKDLEEVLGAAAAMSQNISGTFSTAVVDGLFDGFANADDIVIDFAKRSTKIMADALFEALLGESSRAAATSIFKAILGLGGTAPAPHQFGGTVVGKDSIVRVAEKEPEVVLRARDLRAIERSFSSGGSSAVLVPHVVIDAERTVGQGVSRSLVRGIRPAIRRPRNVAEARIERGR
ncbi:MAG: hypothetical protein ACHQ1G_00060 [Planctomycetota bacterium]